jgi:bifunctional DNA-binding transcriptional regulator/antitoxin component of YhaV-PrlF toxin-antitoxin module
MISTGKSININHKNIFSIPSKWRKKFNIVEGCTVKLRVHYNQVIIQPLMKNTTDIISTVGRGGNIYIPKEVRNYFYHKGIHNLDIYTDEKMRAIIIKPDN